MNNKPYFDSLFLRRLRRIVTRIIPETPLEMSLQAPDYDRKWWINISDEDLQTYLSDLIISSKPFLLTRFGCGVLKAAIDVDNKPNLYNIYRYVTGRTDAIGIQYGTGSILPNDGFYPITYSAIQKYGQLILNCIPQIDILATIMYQDRYFAKQLGDKVRCSFPALEPFHFEHPWTAALENKKVLIIHPFVKTIEYQYNNHREQLFDNPYVLPKFELQTLRAVQMKTISEDPYDTKYETWFDAYEFLKTEIDKRDFDVAILGCGGFGMPLGAHIKAVGKQAIHLGGGVQYLFGIRSHRGDNLPHIAKCYNDYWIRPFDSERPARYKKIEDGCYW